MLSVKPLILLLMVISASTSSAAGYFYVQFSNINVELQNVRTVLSEYQVEYAHAKSLAQQLHETLVAYNETLHELNESYANLNRSWHALTRAFNSLQENYTLLSQDYSTLLNEKRDLEFDYARLKGSFDALAENYSRTLKDLSEVRRNYEELSKMYNNLTKRFDTLYESYSSLQDDYNSLLKLYEQQKQGGYELEQKYYDLKKQYSDLELSYRGLQSKYYDLEMNYRQLQSKYCDLEYDFKVMKALSIGHLLAEYCDSIRSQPQYVAVMLWWRLPAGVTYEAVADRAAWLAEHDLGRIVVFARNVEDEFQRLDPLGRSSYQVAFDKLTEVIGLIGVSYDDPPATRLAKILSFIKNHISYEHDWNEKFLFPVETLGFRSGDCDDFAILAAALFEYVGIDSAVALFYDPARGGHAMTLVHLDGLGGYGYYYYPDLTRHGLQAGKWIIIEPQTTIEDQCSSWVESWGKYLLAAAEV